jgi:hypothetical protein
MSSTYSNLKFEIIGTGEQQGLWGQTTNTNIGTAIEQAIVGMATLEAADFTANVCTLTLSNTNAAQDARALCLNLDAAALSAAGTINVPAIQKPYIVINNTAHAVTVKVSGQTGVAIPAGKRSVLYNNGTDVGEQVTHLTNLAVGTLTLTAPLPIASGGTGTTSTTFVNLASNVTGVLPVANGGTNGLLPVANGGTGTATPALVAGSNVSVTGSWPNQTINAIGFVSAGSPTTFTALQTFAGSSSVAAAKMLNIKEAVTVSATAATGTIAYDVTTQSVLYYTSSASANWTVNFRASSGTSLDAIMSTGESITVAFLVTQGATPRFNSAVQVDGTSVTPKWQGGVAPTGGNANAIDVYTYTIIKTGSAAFTVLASVTQFK